MSRSLIAALAGAMLLAGSAKAAISPADWELYQQKFVTEEGRVVDDANGNVSHSESQGYGLLLSYLAGDPKSFARILTFTRTELLIRDDGLAAWRWDPNAQPRITDINNASDGDLLIAYALAQAGAAWRMPAYTAAARQIGRSLAKVAFARRGGDIYLMPGAKGFSAQEKPDGPVVNPSYWVFEALPVMAQVTGDNSWNIVAATGLKLLDVMARTGQRPLDWVSVKDKPRPAEGFKPELGYNAVRIPLYLLRAGQGEPARLAPFGEAWAQGTATVDARTGQPIEVLSDPGYRILAASIACAMKATPVPPELRTFQPTAYYPSTLHLLSLSMLAEKYPQCM